MDNKINVSGRAMYLKCKCEPLYKKFLRGEIPLTVAEKMLENQERSKKDGRG